MSFCNQVIKLLVFLLFVTSIVFSQSDKTTITGKVTDAETGEALWGANVTVAGTSLGSGVDRDGKYVISGVPAGSKRIVCSYIGYKTEEKTIVIKASEHTHIDFTLKYEAVSVSSVTITAQAQGQLGAINQQINSNTIVNVVSKEKLQELPDVNAAESIGRLPGASIIRDGGEGTKVVVRGLEPKMNAVTVNGVRIPSNSPSDRSVDLSLFSADVLDGIELTKALTPDKDADAIGGTIDLRLKRAEAGSKASFSIQNGYNAHGKNFTPFKVNGSYSNRYFDDDLGLLAQGVIDRADRGSDIFAAGYLVSREKKGDEIYAPTDLASLNLTDDRQTRTKFGASLLIDYKIPNGRLEFNNTYNRLNINQESRRLAYLPSTNDIYHYVTTQKVNTDLLLNSFSGEYSLFDIQSDWNIAFTMTDNKTPDSYNTTFYESSAYKVTPDTKHGPSALPPCAKNDTLSFLQFLGRSNNETKNSDWNLSFNIKVPFTITDELSSYIKFGARYKAKTVDYTNQMALSPMYYTTTALTQLKLLYPDYTSIQGTQGVSMRYFLERGYEPPDNFLDGNYNIPYFANPAFMEKVIDQVTPYLVQRRDYQANNYSDKENITGIYGLGVLNICSNLTLLLGVRYEALSSNFTSYYNNIQVATDGTEMGEISKREASTTNEYWCPQFHLRYKITDWLDVRVAKTRSLSRPDFFALNPYLQISESTQKITRGTPQLKSLTSENYDASISAFNNAWGLLSISGFYKELSNIFYKYSRVVLNPDEFNLESRFKGWDLTDYINSPNTAYIRGFEVDLQTRLYGVVISVNYTKISSETRYPFSVLKTQYIPVFKKTVIDSSRSGRLLYQPNNVLNASIGYDYEGFSGRISVLFQGNTLSSVGSREETDGITADLLRWDLSIKQEIYQGLKVFFNINNITNRADRSYNPVNNYDTSLKYYGQTGELGVMYKF